MTSQDSDMVDKVDETKLAPLWDGEPATGDPSESSPDANVDSREVLETHQDQAMSPGPAASQDTSTSPEPLLSQDRAMSPDSTMSQDPDVSPDRGASQDITASPEPRLSQDRAMSPDSTMSQDTAGSPYQVESQDRATSPVPAESPRSAASPYEVASPYQAVSPYQVASHDLAVSPDPGPHENPQPQNQNGGPDNVERKSPLLWLPFTRKLWMIVEDDAFTSVSWNDAGDTVVIKEDLFQSEVLCRRGAEKIFETNSLKSFICLLNFHGFSKIRPRDPSVYHSVNNRIMIFRNANFQRNKPQLIDNIKRKGHLTITDWPGIGSTPKKKKQAAAPTRRSLRIQLRQRSKDGDMRSQKIDPRAQASSGTRSFMLPSYVSFDNMTRRARGEPFPSEPAGPSGEGTSGNVRLVPMATAARDGAREEPTGPPGFNLAISLYNTYYSIPMAALSATATNNAPEGEEENEQVEEENSSDYKCALCEHLKTKQVPKFPGRW